MSMITQYVRLRSAELVELERLLTEEPDGAYEFAGDRAEQDGDEDGSAPFGMDTDKAWAGLQFLLSGLQPPVDMISGGSLMTDDVWGYDSPRLLDIDEVRMAASFLAQTPFDRLSERYDPALLAAEDVYPNIWDEEWALEYLADTYDRLTAFFAAAADRADCIVVWLG